MLHKNTLIENERLTLTSHFSKEKNTTKMTFACGAHCMCLSSLALHLFKQDGHHLHLYSSHTSQ